MEIVVSGLKTNYITIGEGAPFIILHGWNSGSDRWIKEMEIISKKGFTPLENSGNGVAAKTSGSLTGFKVIVPDLPGFGKSDKLARPWTVNDYVRWFEEFTKELNIREFYLLGYSFGGALAAKISVKYPQRVQKLFLVAAAVIRKKTAKKSFSEKIAKFAKMFYFLPYYHFFRKAVYKFIFRNSDYIYTEGIMKKTYLNVISDDISFHLPFIKVPTVIIWGDKDRSLPIENAHLINEKIKNSKLVIIPEADHLLHKQIPELLAEKVMENL